MGPVSTRFTSGHRRFTACRSPRKSPLRTNDHALPAMPLEMVPTFIAIRILPPDHQLPGEDRALSAGGICQTDLLEKIAKPVPPGVLSQGSLLVIARDSGAFRLMG